MAKDQTLTLASPFKFGFYAGVGFFFASLLMSVLTFLFIGLLGLGTLGALLSGSHTNHDIQPAGSEVKPARWQVSDSR